MHSDTGLMVQFSAVAARRSLLAVAAVAGVLLFVLGVFWPTTRAMIEIWWRSETFAHCFLVVPTFLYLVWRARSDLVAIPVRPFLPALIAAIAVAFVWLVGELANSNAPSQLALIALVPLCTAAVFGWRWLRALAFPMAFLFFAVPLGEALEPFLIDRTADFTVVALQLSGVPVFREGNDFVIPSGSWSVVEACSGIRYLIASLFAGVIYAWLMYRSTTRRVLFVLASIAAPLVANWLRAYGIVMLGHLSDNRIATGVDHLIYGWIFFGIVLFALFSVGAIWREDHLDAKPGTGPAAAPATVSLRRAWPMAAVTALMLVAWTAGRAQLLGASDARPVAIVSMAAGSGWIEVPEAVSPWRPELEGPAGVAVQTFAKGAHRVSVFVGFYRDQDASSKLVSSVNQLARSNNPDWKQIQRGLLGFALADDAVEVRTGRVRGNQQTILVWHWYWLGESTTARDWRAKLDLALDRLAGRSDSSAWVAVFTEEAEGQDAATTLKAFLGDMKRNLDASLARTAQK